MMVASDPKFGGFRPMISKGTIEPGETVLGCALRETQEELGLKDSNICSPAITVFDEYVVLKSVEYHLTIFAVEVMSKHDFDMPGSETKFTTWMTAESFMDRGRRDHQPILQKLVDILNES
jgi:8-oxo-dGTP pyrophosphatase MutT (NUDIX family)